MDGLAAGKTRQQEKKEKSLQAAAAAAVVDTDEMESMNASSLTESAGKDLLRSSGYICTHVFS